MISASADNTALVWDLTGQYGRHRPLQLSSHQLEDLWTDLATDNGEKAYQAVWTLVGAAETSVSFLEPRLRPVAAVPSQKIERMIADLDSDNFEARTQAARDLAELGELAEPVCRKALEKQPSLEVQHALERLMTVWVKQVLSPSQLRVLRAIEVLEQVGSPAAQQVLKTLAEGAPGARLTQEAKAALRRMTK